MDRDEKIASVIAAVAGTTGEFTKTSSVNWVVAAAVAAVDTSWPTQEPKREHVPVVGYLQIWVGPYGEKRTLFAPTLEQLIPSLGLGWRTQGAPFPVGEIK